MNPLASRIAWIAMWPIGALILVTGWYAAQVAVLDHMQPRALSTNVSDSGGPLSPDAPIMLALDGYGAQIAGVELFRADAVLDQGRVGTERAVPIALEQGNGPTWQLTSPGRAPVLAPDGHYRLLVHSAAPRPALPLPSIEQVTSEYQFATVPTPRMTMPSGVLQPRWEEPVAVTWSLPLTAASVVVDPPTPASVWVDPADATRTWLQIESDQGAGLTHRVTFNHVSASNGTTLRAPASLELALPARPSIVEPPMHELIVRPGQTIELQTTVPITDLQTETQGSLAPRAVADGTRIRITVPQFKQGAEGALTLLDARSELGAPLEEPVLLKLRSPAALEPPLIKPDAGARSVPLRTRPYVEFEEPPADPEVVRRSITMRPAIRGEWSWLDEVTLVFTPATRLPEQTEISITLQGGPQGPRNAEGGYLEQNVVRKFVTAPNRRIEVSLSKQQLYMVEGEQVVRTITVGTGVAGAETPLGEYEVLYKMPATRMRGVNPSGLRYDIPDVPWVLPFQGDYAIHGVHWRNSFGAPASNGCVGMTVTEAKLLYDWADVGTPIRIYR